MSLKYRCLFFDLDGTLIKHDETVPQNTLACLNRLRQAGLKISIATGRSYLSAYKFLEQLKISEDCVFTNGAIIRKPGSENFTVIDSIPNNAALKVVNIFKKYDIPFGFQTLEGRNFVSESDKWPKKNDTSQPLTNEIFDSSLTIIKIFFLCYAEQEQALKEKLFKSDRIGLNNIFRSSSWLLELMPNNVSKATAVKIILERWGIDHTEAISVGDQQNDYTMIRDLGFGISVQSGCNKNHTVSKLQIPGPEKKGIEFLTDYIFKKLPI